MKKFFLLVFVGFYHLANATTYYVSNSGSNSNNGTSPSTPWLTISKVNSFSLAAGDIVLFNRGNTWHEALIISHSGSTGNPITYGAYGTGANPIITGFTSVTSWSNLGSNIWESTSAVSALTACNVVTINGVNTPMGRYPNSGFLTYQSHSGTSSITSSGLSGTPNWTGADVVMKNNNFTMNRCAISSQSGGTLNYVSVSQDPFVVDNYGFFIENDVRTLDAQNEWYYNPSTKKIRVYSTSSPTNVKVSTLDSLVYMINKDNITFDGIDFTGASTAAFIVGSCDNITIQNCSLDYALYGVWGGNNFSSTSINFNFNNNTVNHINSQGVYLQSQFTNTYIGHNIFKNCGVLPGMFKIPGVNGGTLWGGAYGAIHCVRNNILHIEYNDIDSVGYAGIWWNPYGGNDNVVINNNHVQHFASILMDGGGIYTWTHNTYTSSTNTKILNNIVHDGIGDNAGTTNTANPLVHGIYLDDNTGGCHVEGNTCFNNSDDGIYVHSAHNCNIKNNTCYNNYTQQILYGSFDFAMRNDSVSNNIFFAKDSTQSVILLASKLNDIGSMFNVLDSNYYTRPILESSSYPTPAPMEVALSDYTTFYHYNLTQWKTLVTPQDAHSAAAPNSISDVSELRFEYNTTSSNKVISLDGSYIDVKGVTYNGIITLAPYASAVLIKNGPAAVQENLLNFSEDLTSASWTHSSAISIVPNDIVAPDGHTTADKVTTTNGFDNLYQTVAVSPSTTYTFSFYAKKGTVGSTDYNVLINNTVGASLTTKVDYSGLINASTWTRVAVSFTTDASTTQIIVLPKNDGGSAGTLWIWGAQLNRGATAADYIKTPNVATIQENLLDYSEDLTNAVWSHSGAISITADNIIAPDGNTTADKVTTSTGFDNLYQTVSVSPSTTYTFSFYAKKGTIGATNYNIQINNTSGASITTKVDYSALINTSTWTRISESFTTNASTTQIIVLPKNDGGSSGTLWIWGAQLNRGAAAADYVKTPEELPLAIGPDTASVINSARSVIKIYPNPFRNSIDINITGKQGNKLKLNILNADGKIVWYKNVISSSNNYHEIINTSAFSKGIYFLKLVSNNKTSVVKLVKQ